MPKVSRVLETSIYVTDLERAVRFYEDLFGFPTLFSDQRLCALDVNGQSVLLVFLRGASASPIDLPGGTIPGHDGAGPLHFALAVDELGPWEQALAERHIVIEARVHWPRGGDSIYFRDPDDHVLELVTPGCWATY